MDLDKEFDYILSLKKFIDQSKKKLSKNEYVKLEYFLNKSSQEDVIDNDFESDSPKINFIPYSTNLNNSNNTELIFLPIEKKINNIHDNTQDKSLENHYKDLLNYSFKK